MKREHWVAVLVALIAVDYFAFVAASPRPADHWYYYLPAVGGWVALHDKINAR